MAWSRVQSKRADTVSNATTVTVTLSSAPTTGNKIVSYAVIGSGSTQTINGVADGNSNSLTAIGGPVTAASFTAAGIFAYDVPGSVSSAFTTTAAAAADQSILAQEISGLITGNTTAMLDATAGTTTGDASGSLAGPSYTTAATNEFLTLLYGDDGSGSTITIPSGYTADANNRNASGDQNVMVAYKNSTGGSETTGTWNSTVTSNYEILGLAIKLPAAAGGVTYVPPRVLPEPPQQYHWWQQRTALIDQSTAANPLVSPLDSAWQADGYYSHLYNEPNDQMRSLANDRAWWPQQKLLVSDPNLLTTALLDPPLVIGRNKEPWRRDPYWTPPGPPGKDPNELATALLEDVLLFDGGADGPSWHRKNDWRRDPYWTPPQREPGWDPNLLVPPGQADPTQSGYLNQPYWVWRRDPYRCDQKDLRDANTVGTPANPLPSPLDVAWQDGGVYWHLYNDWRRPPYWTPPQRQPGWDPNELVAPTNFDPTLAGLLAQAYWVWRRDPYWTPPGPPGKDPNLLNQALLEDELLGIHPKDLWRRDPYWTPPGPPGKDPNPLASALLEGALLGIHPKDIWRRDPYWAPPGEPGKDPNLLLGPFDPTQGGYLGQPYWVWRRDPYWTQLLRWFGPPALNPNGIPSGLPALVSPAQLAALISPSALAALIAPTEKGGKA